GTDAARDAPRAAAGHAARAARRRRRVGRGAVSLLRDEDRWDGMITGITGALTRVLDEEVRLQAGAFEYAVLVPEVVRRQLQTRLGDEVTLHTSHYVEGNQMAARLVPRLIGFLTEAEVEFFELFCTVDKVGAKKALKALVLPVHDIAGAIQRQDVKFLTTLPGIGAATAEQMVTTLKKKVANFTHPTAASAARPAAA